MIRTFVREFKAFALRGNVIDLAVGVIIGAAFGKIVSSFVDDILMPIFSMAVGRVDFSQWFVSLDGHRYATLAAAEAAGAPVLRIGFFINALIQFFLIALALFVFIRYVNAVKDRAARLAKARQEATGDEGSANQGTLETVLCRFCCEPVHPEARRCPHCTSDLIVDN